MCPPPSTSSSDPWNSQSRPQLGKVACSPKRAKVPQKAEIPYIGEDVGIYIQINFCETYIFYIYIILQHDDFTESPKSRKIQKTNEGLNVHFPYYFFIKKCILRRSQRGTPLGGLSPQNNVHASPN